MSCEVDDKIERLLKLGSEVVNLINCEANRKKSAKSYQKYVLASVVLAVEGLNLSIGIELQ